MEFEPFAKMARLTRDCVITEKLDGTNAQIFIEGDVILAGSRNRWITPEDDNYGFAGWVQRNRDDLMSLGDGRHFGEWWGAGIQRRYGLTGSDKRFSLFNVHRWGAPLGDVLRPACCGVVPVLYRGLFSSDAVEITLDSLRDFGSEAVPGFMNPEGVVVFHAASGELFKKTLDNDAVPKSQVAHAA